MMSSLRPTTTRSRRSDAELVPNRGINGDGDLEAQAKSTGMDAQFAGSTDTLVHRDALGRLKQVSNMEDSEHGWYLDPNDAKLAEIQKVQKTTNMHSKLPWVIQMAASGYESNGKGVLSIRTNQYALACLALPFLVSEA